MAVFNTVHFYRSTFLCVSLKTKTVSCDNIQTTLGKIFMSKCTFLKSHFLLIVVFLGITLLFSEVVPGTHLQ